MSVGLRAAARIALALVFVAGWVGASSAQSLATAKPRGGVHVYLFRGFTGIFSQGMDEIGGKLRRRGITATVHPHFSWGSQASEAIQDYKSGRTRTIVLIGHSMGGPSVINMAEELGRAGVPVALIVTFDPVGSLVTPSNVRQLVNYYVSGGVGVTVGRSQGSRGTVVNADQSAAGLGHVSVQYSETMQEKAVGNVLAAIGAQRAPAAVARPRAPRPDPRPDTTTTSAVPVAPAADEAVKQ